MNIFGPWDQDNSQSPPYWKTFIFSGETNTAIHGLVEDDMARGAQPTG